jgi:hypothetical protein
MMNRRNLLASILATSLWCGGRSLELLRGIRGSRSTAPAPRSPCVSLREATALQRDWPWMRRTTSTLQTAWRLRSMRPARLSFFTRSAKGTARGCWPSDPGEG